MLSGIHSRSPFKATSSRLTVRGALTGAAPLALAEVPGLLGKAVAAGGESGYDAATDAGLQPTEVLMAVLVSLNGFKHSEAT